MILFHVLALQQLGTCNPHYNCTDSDVPSILRDSSDRGFWVWGQLLLYYEEYWGSCYRIPVESAPLRRTTRSSSRINWIVIIHLPVAHIPNTLSPPDFVQQVSLRTQVIVLCIMIVSVWVSDLYSRFSPFSSGMTSCHWKVCEHYHFTSYQLFYRICSISLTLSWIT